jgi:hypothetical protein
MEDQPMTTDLVPREPATVLAAASDQTSSALERLREWVSAASDAAALVSPLVDTPFIPDSYRPRVDPRATAEEHQKAREIAVATATAAVLQGVTLGLDPLTSLQQIIIIHGRPSLYAKMAVALVQSYGHEVWTEDLSATRAVVCGRRKGTSHIERITVTMDQARRAKWTRNEAYEKTPEDMLWARASARVCDRIASDVLRGVAVREVAEDDAAVAAAGTTGARTVRPPARPAIPAPDPRAAAEPATSQPEPSMEPAAELAAEPMAEPAEEPRASRSQALRILALLRELGIPDRGKALEAISRKVSRQVAAVSDLTCGEADDVASAIERAVKAKTGARPEPAGEPPLKASYEATQNGELLDEDFAAHQLPGQTPVEDPPLEDSQWPTAVRPADAE